MGTRTPQKGDTVMIPCTVDEIQTNGYWAYLKPIGLEWDIETEYDNPTGRIEISREEWSKLDFKSGPLPDKIGSIVYATVSPNQTTPKLMLVRANVPNAKNWFAPEINSWFSPEDIYEWMLDA